MQKSTHGFGEVVLYNTNVGALLGFPMAGIPTRVLKQILRDQNRCENLTILSNTLNRVNEFALKFDNRVLRVIFGGNGIKMT